MRWLIVGAAVALLSVLPMKVYADECYVQTVIGTTGGKPDPASSRMQKRTFTMSGGKVTQASGCSSATAGIAPKDKLCPKEIAKCELSLKPNR